LPNLHNLVIIGTYSEANSTLETSLQINCKF